MKHKRTDDKYWLDINNFNHLKYESDLEDYIIDLENKLKEGKELSDSEIHKMAYARYSFTEHDKMNGFVEGMKAYREQLKQRNWGK